MSDAKAYEDDFSDFKTGALALQNDVRDPQKVLEAHLGWNRGTSAAYYFALGYQRAAGEAGVPVGDSLRLVRELIKESDRSL